MYIPHYDALLHAIGTSREQLKDKTEVTIPVSMFKLLLQQTLLNGEFNVAGYLAANKDIQDAVKKNQMPDPKSHYIKFGFFEGRRGATPPVDESWYRRTYSDIATALSRGELTSGAAHFDMIGAEEFRAPSASFINDALEWKKSVRKS
jgi:hypothetical protein